MSKGKTGSANSALKALGNYGEEILKAFLQANGRIEDVPENDALIQVLRKHRMIWRLDDADSYQIRNVVTRLLDHITESHRRHSAHEHIAGQWVYLQDRFDAYRIAINNGLVEDRRNLEDEIPERILELIEDIRQAATGFNQYVTSEFAYINNLELRIRENDRVLGRAHSLNVLFDSFSITEMAQLSLGEPFLEKLLQKHLPGALEKSRKDLGHALFQLRKLLSRLQEEQKMVKLLSMFEGVYANNPGFMPDIEDVDFSRCPDSINAAAPFLIGGYADLLDPDGENVLSDLANGLRKDKSEDRAPDSPRVPIDVSQEPDREVMQPDPIQEAIGQLIIMVTEEGMSVGAKHSRMAMDLDIDLPSWLQMISTDVSALPEELRQAITMEYRGVNDERYPDNMYVNDVILRPVHAP